MKFIEESTNKYYGIYNDEIVYIIIRGEYPPHRWIDFDNLMNQVGESNQFRHDLFEEVEDIFYGKNTK